ncbi:MAG: maleylpyruvate isomerase family mycothiol-dependent enzyme [Actinobacteria bacterium]|nr:maleylpyruvate isomerase family mycothiol-dependent enzyme [Actinomycetota bacterium]
MKDLRPVAAMTADRTAGIIVGLDELPDALALLRRRLLALAEGLSPDRWAGPSRCHRWTVHDVLRHVRDACRLHVTGLRRDPHWPFDKPFDNRATPDEWLSLSTGQTPEQTLDELRRWSDDETPALLERLESRDQDIVRGPYGPIPWTILSMHVLWDGWLHERDVAEVTGGGSPSTPIEDAAVATYALFIASMAAFLQDQPLDVTVALSGNGRHSVAAVRPGHVELRTVASPPTADLHGTLDAVVDSLAGRGPLLAELLAGDPGKCEPLTRLRAMLAPSPAS